MEFLQQLFLYASFTAIIFLIVGLFKPWMMLWWEDVQNRRKVIKVYGLSAIISYALHWGVGFLS
jgi:hypothetical protein